MIEDSNQRDKKKRQPLKKHFDPYHNGYADVTNHNHSDYADNNESGTDTIEGRNAVLEALKAGITIDKIFVSKENIDSTLRHIISKAKDSGFVVVETDKRKLDTMSQTGSHQGIIAVASCVDYVTVDEIINNAVSKDEKALIVICESISDPHNLGAIIRTCEAAGVHGVIIPKRRSAGLGATVAKASSGAVYHVPVSRVTNITSTIKELKKSGLWIFGTSATGQTDLWQTDFSVPCAIVIGSEGAGISRLVKENCDYLVNIPMFGKIASLNASVSAAILMYEVVRQRNR